MYRSCLEKHSGCNLAVIVVDDGEPYSEVRALAGKKSKEVFPTPFESISNFSKNDSFLKLNRGNLFFKTHGKNNKMEFSIVIKRILVATQMIGCILLANNAFAKQPDGITGNVTVMNDSSAPIPVAGEISSIVTGEVDVGRLPDIVTEMLEDIASATSDIEERVTAIEERTRPATYSRVFENSEICSICPWFEDLDFPVMASFISISAENDSGTIRFCSDTFFECSDPERVMVLGNPNKEFPGVLVIPLPQPVKIQSFTWRCSNSVEDCEVKVSIVGRPADT